MKYNLETKKSYSYLTLRGISSINVFKESYKNNIMYILLKEGDKELKFSMNGSLPIYISDGYEVIGKKFGSEEELKLLENTFSEISLNKTYMASKSICVDNLLAYLDILGCTVINKKPRSKKKYIA